MHIRGETEVALMMLPPSTCVSSLDRGGMVGGVSKA